MFNETGSYYLAYANHFDPNDPSTSFPCSHLMGAVGGPQLWDFSNGPTNEVSRFDYLAPGGADVAEAFPQATRAEQKSTTFGGQTKTNALYFSQIPGIGRKVFGFYDPEFSSLTPTNVFQPPIVDFPDEIRYLDTWNTTFTLFTTIDVPLLNVSFPAQLNYSSVFTADAYGTVDLPKLGFGSALRINEAPDYKGLTIEGNDLGVSLGSYGYNANGVKWTPSPLGLGGVLSKAPANSQFGTLSADALRVSDSSVKVPSDMMALGDATLIWTPAAIQRALYKNNATQDSYDGMAMLDINSRNGVERANYVGSKGIIHATLARHSGRYNVVFCDDHVQGIARNELFQKADPALARWNNDHQPHPELLTPY